MCSLSADGEANGVGARERGRSKWQSRRIHVDRGDGILVHEHTWIGIVQVPYPAVHSGRAQKCADGWIQYAGTFSASICFSVTSVVVTGVATHELATRVENFQRNRLFGALPR